MLQTETQKQALVHDFLLEGYVYVEEQDARVAREILLERVGPITFYGVGDRWVKITAPQTELA